VASEEPKRGRRDVGDDGISWDRTNRGLRRHDLARLLERRQAIMSSNGVPIRDISDTVGHKSTHATETVYRHVIVPRIRGGASVMDDVFGEPDEDDRDIA
jgi:integrase